MKKIIDGAVAVVAVITIMVLTFGATYAWFISSTKTDNVDLVKSGKLDIVYNKGNDVVDGELVPSSSKDVGIKTSVTIRRTEDSVNGLATITLHLDEFPEVLKTSALKWEVYQNINGETTLYKQGDFRSATQGGTIDIVTDYQVATSDTIFTLYIWLDGSGVGNEVIGATFKGHLTSSAYSKGKLR